MAAPRSLFIYHNEYGLNIRSYYTALVLSCGTLLPLYFYDCVHLKVTFSIYESYLNYNRVTHCLKILYMFCNFRT